MHIFPIIKSQNDILYSGSATLRVHMFEPNNEESKHLLLPYVIKTWNKRKALMGAGNNLRQVKTIKFSQ